MPTLGSSTAPSWAGWIWPGAGYIAGINVTTPSFPILVTDVHGYFNTYNGNGAHGWLALFDAANNLIWRGDKGIINNGTLNAGGQQWWSWSPNPAPNVTIEANTSIWICFYSDQNLVFSTYDTSPHAYDESNGTNYHPWSIGGMKDTGQGPCGAYLNYSKIIRSGPVSMGSAGGGISVPAISTGITSGPVSMGSAGGGMSVPVAQVLAGVSATLGNQGGGLRIANSVVRVPTIKVWRKS